MLYLTTYKPNRFPPIWLLFLLLVSAPLHLMRAGDQLAAKTTAPPKVETKKETSVLSFWDGRIVIDIEERMRVEVRNNNRDFDSGSHEITDGAWLLNRFRLGLAITPSSWVKLYAQTQDSREADRKSV